METYWNPQQLVYQYIHAYFNIFQQNCIPLKSVKLSFQKNHQSKSAMQKIERKNDVPQQEKQQSIRALYQKYAQQDVYIFGNGPSLFKVKLEDFKDKICFGINYSFEVMPYMDYILVHEVETYNSIKNVLPNNKLLLPETLVRHHFGDGRVEKGPHRIATTNKEAWIYPIQNPYQKNINAKNVCLNKEATIFTWSTTTHSAIHLAAYMGAKNIFLIGVDYKLFPNGKVHFDSKYSSIYGQQKWNANKKHRQGDEWLKKALAEKGGSVRKFKCLLSKPFFYKYDCKKKTCHQM